MKRRDLASFVAEKMGLESGKAVSISVITEAILGADWISAVKLSALCL